MRNLLLYIMVCALFFPISCAPTRIQQVPITHITKDSIFYNIVHKDTIIYHNIEADTIKSTQNLILDNFGKSRDTMSILVNNYSTSVVRLTRMSQNEFNLNHYLFQKKVSLEIPIRFVYLDKYIIKYEEKEVPIEVKVEIPIRDKLFWISIIGNVIFLFLLLMIIKKRIGI